MRITLIPIIVGSILLSLHAMFPPRILPLHESRVPYRIDRAYIFGDHYYRQYLTEGGHVLSPSKREQSKSIQELQLDWDLFITETIALLGVSILATSLFSLAAMPRKQQSEQGSARQPTTR